MPTPTPSLFDEMVRRGLASEYDIERRAQIARAEAIASALDATGRTLRRMLQGLIFRFTPTKKAGQVGTAAPMSPANAGQRERDAA